MERDLVLMSLAPEMMGRNSPTPLAEDSAVDDIFLEVQAQAEAEVRQQQEREENEERRRRQQRLRTRLANLRRSAFTTKHRAVAAFLQKRRELLELPRLPSKRTAPAGRRGEWRLKPPNRSPTVELGNDIIKSRWTTKRPKSTSRL